MSNFMNKLYIVHRTCHQLTTLKPIIIIFFYILLFQISMHREFYIKHSKHLYYFSKKTFPIYILTKIKIKMFCKRDLCF